MMPCWSAKPENDLTSSHGNCRQLHQQKLMFSQCTLESAKPALHIGSLLLLMGFFFVEFASHAKAQEQSAPHPLPLANTPVRQKITCTYRCTDNVISRKLTTTMEAESCPRQ
jgi:hypothetical protein